ncbi:G-type lectin S-receptor-like serine/threonine-protein kinase [Hirschfeldia incana]|nr:G-type lectin S-receptor-like serine/threonine-protein kinase [Hirschfeldia incana]
MHLANCPNNTHNQYVGIWFKGIIPRVVVWVANREKPVTDSTANLAIFSNGSILLFSSKDGIVWSSGETFASNGSHAELLDSVSIVLVDKVSGRTLWQSFEHLGDTLLHSSFLMYNIITGEKRVLPSWKSYTDPSPGDFVGEITPQVPSQGFIMRGSRRYWRSGPWAKTRFTGVPLMDESYTSTLSLHQDVNGSGYLTYFQRNYKLSRIVLTPEGSLKIFRHNGSKWELYYEAPLANSCDIHGVCGPFGFCVGSVPSKCKCFKRFVPKSIEEWKRGNWTSGCVRPTKLLCQGNSTGEDVNSFHLVANIKPPDNYEFVNSLNAEECYQSCFRNCSCFAFSYISGIGCLVWNHDLMDAVQFCAGGELLSIRLARSELAHIIEDAWRNELKPQDVPGHSPRPEEDICLLKIISGEKISRFSHAGKTLLAYAWDFWSENKGTNLLDQVVTNSCCPSEVGRCVQIGLLCVQHRPADRPNTLELLSMLTTTSDLPSPKQPTFVVHVSDCEPQFKDLITVNEMTQSAILGR